MGMNSANGSSMPMAVAYAAVSAAPVVLDRVTVTGIQTDSRRTWSITPEFFVECRHIAQNSG
jgi:hypothetical protein